MPVTKDIELPKLRIDLTLTAGVHASEGADDHGGATLADVASFHELGLGSPTRSFLRAWFDEHESEIGDRVEQAIGDSIVDDRPLDPALDRVAEWIAGGIKSRIYDGIPPALGKSTRKRRGDGAVPLIDTGQLISAIRAEVRLRYLD